MLLTLHNTHYRKLAEQLKDKNNNYYSTMFNLRAKKSYLAPRVAVAEMDPEGICSGSLRFNMQVNPLDNMNDPDDPKKGIGEAADEAFYFES